MSELDPAAYSGVHTGPLRAGEWVSLTDAKGHRKSLLLEAGNATVSDAFIASRLEGRGRVYGTLPRGVDVEALLAAGTANQTRLVGAPVKGPLFEFAPAIDEYLKTHLFGDIFERDNLDWQSRELATVGALAATPGVEAQLRSHMAASMRVGLTAAQLHQLTQVLAERGDAQAAQRASDALKQALAARK